MVAPPSLEEVQQSKGRRAEEVLKELLERVVEAALGQAEGGVVMKWQKVTSRGPWVR